MPESFSDVNELRLALCWMLDDVNELRLALCWMLVQFCGAEPEIDTWALGAAETAVKLLQEAGWVDQRRRFTPLALSFDGALPHA